MGNRITFDEICQQLCSIYRVTLCSFQNEVQNDSPYLVRYGQLESVSVRDTNFRAFFIPKLR